jgi:hypothetical protein
MEGSKGQDKKPPLGGYKGSLIISDVLGQKRINVKIC